MTLCVKIKYSESADKSLRLPQYKSDYASGCDLMAHLLIRNRETGIELLPGKRKYISVGIVVEIPIGYEAQIRPRSGLALKYGIGIINSPGTIDSDYRGELGVLLINLGSKKYKIEHGDRIAQLVFSPVEKVKFQLINDISNTERGIKGFGSTGKKNWFGGLFGK